MGFSGGGFWSLLSFGPAAGTTVRVQGQWTSPLTAAGRGPSECILLEQEHAVRFFEASAQHPLPLHPPHPSVPLSQFLSPLLCIVVNQNKSAKCFLPRSPGAASASSCGLSNVITRLSPP